jgi:hypothetical protein
MTSSPKANESGCGTREIPGRAFFHFGAEGSPVTKSGSWLLGFEMLAKRGGGEQGEGPDQWSKGRMAGPKSRSDPEWREKPASGGKKRKKIDFGQEEDLPNWEKTEEPQVSLADRKRKIPRRL